MHNDADLEQYDEWSEGFSGETDIQAMMRAGISGTIHVHQQALLQAHKALLEKTFISSRDEAYFWVKTQYQALKEWHRLHTGWHLEWRGDLFCLMRQPGVLTSGYSDSKYILQAARDFVYVLWILWYAANDQIAKRGSGQLFLLLQMLERLSEEWRQQQGCSNLLMSGENTDLSNQPSIMSNRKSMARALKYLQELQCLKELDGQIDVWVEQDGPVLYQFTNAIHLLIMSLDLEALNAVVAHQKEATIFTPAVLSGRKEKLSALMRAWRTLLIGPFLLKFDDLEAFVALIKHVEGVRSELDTSFGWSLEVNHDYACIIRDRDISSSTFGSLLNPRNTSDQVVLLLCNGLRNHVTAGTLKPDYYGCISTTVPDLQDLFASMRGHFEVYWGKGVRDKGNKELLGEALRKMRRIGFIRGPDSKNTVLILPTAARYSAQYIEHSIDIPSYTSKKERRKEQEYFEQTNLWLDEEKITGN